MTKFATIKTAAIVSDDADPKQIAAQALAALENDTNAPAIEVPTTPIIEITEK